MKKFLLCLVLLIPGCNVITVADYERLISRTVYKNHHKSVCKIKSFTLSNKFTGNGVLVKKVGEFYYVLTASHVVNYNHTYVKLIDGTDLFGTSFTFEAHNVTVVRRDRKRDLCLLRFKSKKIYPIIKIGSRLDLTQERRFVFLSLMPFPFTFSLMYCQKYGRRQIKATHWKNRRNIIHGQSGSPIFFANGNLAGILITTPDYVVGNFVTAEVIKDFLKGVK